jgi:uncharacterized integral membrane protein
LRILFLVLGMIFLAICLVVAAGNWQPMPLSLVGTTMSLPVGVLPLLGIAAGAFLVAGAWFSRQAKSETSKAIQSDWQAQDAKLIASVKSDREKQLEAKIATLESALKQALKKGSGS